MTAPKIYSDNPQELADGAPIGTTWREIDHGDGPGELAVVVRTVVDLPKRWGGWWKLSTSIEGADPTAEEWREHLDYWEAPARRVIARVASLRETYCRSES